MPAGSKAGLMLAKVEPINKRVTDSKGEKSCYATAARKREVRISERQLCRHQGRCRMREKRCSGHWSGDSAAAHGEAAVPLAARGDPFWSRVLHLQPVELVNAQRRL